MFCQYRRTPLRLRSDVIGVQPNSQVVQRLEVQKGLPQGLALAQGELPNSLLQLTRLCGTMPDDVQQRVRQLTLDQSQSLGQALLDFKTLDDLRVWLKTIDV